MRKLGRKKAHREHMLKNLATSIILYEKVMTTSAKAKVAGSIVEKMINLAKQNSLVAKRKLLSYFNDDNTVKKIYEELIPRFKNINSGYWKLYKLGNNLGNGSVKVLIQLIPAKKQSHISELSDIKTTVKTKKK